jgi:hypothetical protein
MRLFFLRFCVDPRMQHGSKGPTIGIVLRTFHRPTSSIYTLDTANCRFSEKVWFGVREVQLLGQFLQPKTYYYCERRRIRIGKWGSLMVVQCTKPCGSPPFMLADPAIATRNYSVESVAHRDRSSRCPARVTMPARS